MTSYSGLFCCGGEGWSCIGDSGVGEFRSVQIIPQSVVQEVIGKPLVEVVTIDEDCARRFDQARIVDVEDGEFGQVLKLLFV